MASAKVELESIASDLTATADALASDIDNSIWHTAVAKSSEAYQQVQNELKAQGGDDPAVFGNLLREKQRIEGELRRIEVLEKQHAEVLAEARTHWKEVADARGAISKARSTFLATTLEQNKFVRIQLIPFGRDWDEIERSLRELLGCGEKYADDIYVRADDSNPPSGLVGELRIAAELASSPSDGFDNGLKTLRKRLVDACNGEGTFGNWFNKFLVTEAERRHDFVDQILCWFPEDRLSVEHSRKADGRDFQPIGQASAGQRAAAMLAFLLAHGTDPLILDQPEDDLDNHLIYDLVVKQMRANKQRRQIVVVTHNPNIVVNGDSEMLYALDFNNQCFVKKAGSLQSKEMRDEICQVMEGGREAFERRYKRLGKTV
jgi:hypothetical protein